MKLSPLEELLLASVLADRDRLAAKYPLIWERGSDRHQYARDRVAIEDAHAGIVAINWPGWLGHFPDVAERKADSRAVHRMMELGLLIGHGNSQMKFVEMTPAGETAAKAITSEPEASA